MANDVCRNCFYAKTFTLYETSDDYVKVVRCEDCKHYEWNPFDGCEVCTRGCGYVRPDFGCVDGERKDNG
jgi:hypothetical protein